MKEISFSDNPAGKDELGIESLYKGLAELIKKATRPFVLAVVGEWGCGKTTLIRFSLNELKEDYTVVEFNAWSHGKDMPLLQGLFTHLSTIKGTSWDKVKVRLKKLINSPIAGIAARGVGALAGPVGAAVAEAALAYSEKNQKRKRNLVDNVESFTKEFQAVALEFERQKKPLLVFVDDLDRCTPTEALNLIDDIKIYLTINAPVAFILAIDRRTLQMGIRAKYGAQSEISVDDYLQKIFSYAVFMPTFTELKVLIKNAIDSVRTAENGSDLTEEKALDAIRECKIKSLRSIKRIIRRWAFMTPSNTRDYLKKTGLPDNVVQEANTENLSIFILLLCALFELYPEYFGTFMRFEGDPPFPILQGTVGPETINLPYQKYFEWSGFEGDIGKEIKRIRGIDVTRDMIIKNLLKSSFLTFQDIPHLRKDYAKAIYLIMHAVELGLPLA